MTKREIVIAIAAAITGITGFLIGRRFREKREIKKLKRDLGNSIIDMLERAAKEMDERLTKEEQETLGNLFEKENNGTLTEDEAKTLSELKHKLD